MGREQYKLPDADIAAEFDRVCELFQLALGKPSDRVLFDSLMSEANDKGLNWVQGLEYVVHQRTVDAAEETAVVVSGIEEGRKAVAGQAVRMSEEMDLRRAG